MQGTWHVLKRYEIDTSFGSEPEGCSPLGRPRSRWEYNIKIVLTQAGWVYVSWIRLAQDKDQWRVDSVYNYWLLKDEKCSKKRDNERDEIFNP